MKRAKRIFDWIPIIGGLPMVFGSKAAKLRYMNYPDSWFELNIISGCIGLLGLAAVITTAIMKLTT